MPQSFVTVNSCNDLLAGPGPSGAGSWLTPVCADYVLTAENLTTGGRRRDDTDLPAGQYRTDDFSLHSIAVPLRRWGDTQIATLNVGSAGCRWRSSNLVTISASNSILSWMIYSYTV